MGIICHVKFGDSDTQEMLVEIEPEEPVIDFVRRLVEESYAIGRIRDRYAIDKRMMVWANGRRINHVDHPLPQALREQSKLVTIEVRTLETPLKLEIFFTSDKKKKLREAPETIEVNPARPLAEQLEEQGFFARICPEHTWFKKKLSSGKEFLFFGGVRIIPHKYIHPKKSIWECGIRRSQSILMKPKLWWEWPPRIIFPPPFTGFSIVTLLLLFLFAIPAPKYSLRFKCEKPFYVEALGPDNAKVGQISTESAPYKAELKNLKFGRYTIKALPKEAPIKEWKLNLRYSILFELLRRAFPLEASSDCNGETIPFVLKTHRGSIDAPTSDSLFINTFHYKRGVEPVDIRLCPGKYRIECRSASTPPVHVLKEYTLLPYHLAFPHTAEWMQINLKHAQNDSMRVFLTHPIIAP